MFRSILSAFCLIFTFSITQNVKSQESVKHVSSGTNDIKVLFNQQTIPWEIKKEDISFPFLGKANAVGFVTDTDTLQFQLKPGDTVKLRFIVQQSDTIPVTVMGQVNPAQFDPSYIKNNRGKYGVFLPEVHELVNIAVALTHIGRKDSNMVFMETDYYKKVIRHFDEFSDHTLIDSLNQHITEVFGSETYTYYYNIRMNANMYTFENDRIVNKSPYITMGFGGNNELEPLLSLLADFSEASDFRAFYQENKTYYENLVKSYYEVVPVDKMWAWVENKFPQRYDSYQIYFSPLVGGAHSTQGFKSNDFKQTVMFIDAPVFTRNYSQQEKEAILSRVVFTEIDHNYVNPTSDKYDEIGELLTPLSCWNNGSQSYESSYATFNEYMTWAVFSMYLYDNFDPEIFEKRNKIEARFMAEGRGFIRFPEFNDFALEWYKNHPDTSLEAFYPAAIEWFKIQDCEQAAEE